MKNYILGYGSLMETNSRLKTTARTENAYPVKIKGLKRGWFGRTNVIGFSTTYLSCIQDNSQSINGVIYEVSNEEIKLTDEREIGYKRILINYKFITIYSDKFTLDENAKIWVYTSDFLDNKVPKSQLPSKNFPIVQSYVDICINGCLEIEKNFPKAKENQFTINFIHSTFYWSPNWENDRIYPRRPFEFTPNAHFIDKLLKNNLLDKSIFNKIYLS